MQHGPPELNINLKPANISFEIIQSWNPLFTIVKVKMYVFSAPNMSRHPMYPEYRNVKQDRWRESASYHCWLWCEDH